MVVTRVVYNKAVGSKSLAVCDVVLDNSLKLSGIGLRKGNDGYFLIFPSKQDVYNSIKTLNEGIFIQYPNNSKGCSNSENRSKNYEEFYHPVTNVFYTSLLKEVVNGYEINENKLLSGATNLSYRPSSRGCYE